jgi:hypothetical protein
MSTHVSFDDMLDCGRRLAVDLPRIADATEIISESEVRCAGVRGVPAAANLGLPGPPSAPAIGMLETLLYQYTYCTPLGSPALPSTNPAPHDLLEALSMANRSQDRVEPFWEYAEPGPDGRAVVRRGNETRSVWPGEFVSHLGPGVSPHPGSPVSLFMPREAIALQLGFYFAFGEALPDAEPAWVRLYFNVRPSGAARLIERATALLNWLQVPFRMKCLTSSALLGRTDGAVLYLHRRRYAAASRILPQLYADLRRDLDSSCCLFAKPLAPGLSLAEDPPEGGSFGMSRCRIVAEGLYTAWVNGVRDGAGKVAAVRHAFLAHGVAADAPYLNPGSVDHYDIPEELAHAVRRAA